MHRLEGEKVAKRYGTSKSQWRRNAQSGGMQAINFTCRTAGKTGTALGRWMTTDHSGMARALESEPRLRFRDTVVCMLIYLVSGVIGAILTGAWITFLIAYGIPFLITGKF